MDWRMPSHDQAPGPHRAHADRGGQRGALHRGRGAGAVAQRSRPQMAGAAAGLLVRHRAGAGRGGRRRGAGAVHLRDLLTMLAEALELLACPRCAGPLARTLRCGSCGAEHSIRGGIPDLRLAADPRTEAVRAFYTRAPFPGYPPRDSFSWLRARAERSELARLLD